MMYQQRLYVAYSAEDRTDIEDDYRNVIGVSKLGAETQFHYGAVFNTEDPFEFTVPFQDSGKIVAMLPTERALIFTTNAVYMLLGRSDDGIVTPTEVNPTKVYSSGCSASVLPIQVKDKAFFLNSDHSSLVSVSFNKVSGRGVQIFETDAYAKHFLEKSIIQMAATISFETIIWLLREDGSLISMTQYEGEEDVYGFGFHELGEGYIENIAPVRLNRVYIPTKENRTPPYETLGATIIRDGKRSFEVMAFRDDSDDRNMAFLDSQVPFGNRMIQESSGRWVYPDTVNYGQRFVSAPRDFSVLLQIRSDPRLAPFEDSQANYTYHPSTFIIQSDWFNNKAELFESITSRMLAGNGGSGTGNVYGGSYTRESLFTFEFPDYDLNFHPPINISSTDTQGDVRVKFIMDGLTAKIGYDPTFAAGTDNVLRAARTRAARDDMIAFVNSYANLSVSTDEERAGRDWFADNLANPLVRDGFTFWYKPPERLQVYYGDNKSVVLRLKTETRIADDVVYEHRRHYSDGGYLSAILPHFIPADEDVTFVTRRASEGFRFHEDGSPMRYVHEYEYTIDQEVLPDELNNVLGDESIPNSEALIRSTNWAIMSNRITNLRHLAGKRVGVFADNEVVSNPNTRTERLKDKVLTVGADGTLELPEHYTHGFVGLPYRFEMESLQIDAQDQRTIISGRKIINKLVTALHRTRGGRMGSISGMEVDEANDQTFPIFEQLERKFVRENGSFDGAIEQNLSSAWSDEGRIRIVQDDPLPITVNAIYPKGLESGD